MKENDGLKDRIRFNLVKYGISCLIIVFLRYWIYNYGYMIFNS